MKERDIRPKNLHETILRLSKEDTKKFLLPNKKKLKKINCPACGGKKSVFQFNKFGLDYVLCSKCRTLYLSPRPSQKMMNDLYNHLKSVRYWETDFYKGTAEARREKIFVPRAKKVVMASKQYLKTKSPTLVDLGCGYGIFMEEIKKLSYFGDISGIEPTGLLAEASSARGFKVQQKWITLKNVKDLDVRTDVLTCFEVLEHVINPIIFLKTFKQIIKKGGLFILSFPSASGLDIQTLWEKSNTIYPPHHINLFTIEGVKELVKRAGNLEILSLTTPGKLDVDIVKNAIKYGKVKKLEGFLDYLFWRGNVDDLEKIQEYCQKHLFSSHLFLVLRKI